ncbi:hypothetical protein [Nonomuraea basaltis]|uniref:hypothetical protein n=1 Tax=Nonomuraea basaltis TaxID=2495887 RepID=UPI00110C6EEC|nr:hypothetical protein [Nonomuraea basaltis]TMR90150.1 hypothetical protein EJK15_56915 [Nonomuraea basaltis]
MLSADRPSGLHEPAGGGYVDDFAIEVLTVISAATKRLNDARTVGDDHGVRVYSERVRYLLTVAQRHGVDTTSLSVVRERLEAGEA